MCVFYLCYKMFTTNALIHLISARVYKSTLVCLIVWLYMVYVHIMFMSTSNPIRLINIKYEIATIQMIQAHKRIHTHTSNQSLIIPHNKSFQTPQTYTATHQFNITEYWRKVYMSILCYTQAEWCTRDSKVCTYVMPSGTIASYILVQWQWYFSNIVNTYTRVI